MTKSAHVPDISLAVPYESDGWVIQESGFDAALRERSESIFSLGNGFIGVRGGFEEALDEESLTGRAEVYLNGVYETVPISYHENAHGFAESSDVRPQAANTTGLCIEIDGSAFCLSEGEVLSYDRSLDLKSGSVRRSVHWRAPSGTSVHLVFERLVSLEDRAILAQRVSVRADEKDVQLRIQSELDAAHYDRPSVSSDNEDAADAVHDPRLGPTFKSSPWQLENLIETDSIGGYLHRLKKSGIRVAVASTHRTDGLEVEIGGEDKSEKAKGLVWRFGTRLKAGETAILTKFSGYATDFGDQAAESNEDLTARVVKALEKAKKRDFDDFLEAQRQHLSQFWSGCNVEIEGCARDTAAIRFNMFQLLQASAPGGHTSICAKGQTGEGYEGHYFWDAEIFGLPLLAHSAPVLARDLLVYRHKTLDAARQNARDMGHAQGALVAWRTIGGRECSAYFPAGSAQYHINADVAYAIRRYVEATGDKDFLISHGAELLFETARIWLQIGFFNDRKDGAFYINAVTGPDEYTAIVNNNLYTNVMAKAHLDYAVHVAGWMQKYASARASELLEKLDISATEIAHWKQAADHMYLPYDEDLRIHPQDDSFLDKKKWDIAGTPAEKFPLLLHYHPLTIYRHQVCKQADTVLAMFLQGHYFDDGDIARNLDYYESVTVHDSTLSAGCFSIVASKAGLIEKAYDYFRNAVYVDLADVHGNTSHGLHLASAGGSWMSVVHGFAGLRITEDGLNFSPILPKAWPSYSFRIRYCGRLLHVLVRSDEAQYELLAGDPLHIRHNGEIVSLMMHETACVPMEPEIA